MTLYANGIYILLRLVSPISMAQYLPGLNTRYNSSAAFVIQFTNLSISRILDKSPAISPLLYLMVSAHGGWVKTKSTLSLFIPVSFRASRLKMCDLKSLSILDFRDSHVHSRPFPIVYLYEFLLHQQNQERLFVYLHFVLYLIRAHVHKRPYQNLQSIIFRLPTSDILIVLIYLCYDILRNYYQSND